jgi:riboflavin kinase/FMN adenylyltransferase
LDLQFLKTVQYNLIQYTTIMIIQQNLEPTEGIRTITIGNFDGIHRGHQKVLHKVLSCKKPVAVVTFKNHPSQILRPEKKSPLIMTNEHKIQCFETLGIDFLMMIPFTKDLSEQSAEEFLLSLYQKIPFETLVLGHDATLGKGKHGDKKVVQELAKKIGFKVIYTEEFIVEGSPLSSSRIRHHIQKGELERASLFLGRPYSIVAKVMQGLGLGKTIGARTANLDVSELVTPPQGVWAVKAKVRGELIPAVANLGIAPTVRHSSDVRLEVHLLDGSPNLEGEIIEVFFSRYLRAEHKFESLQALGEQIQEDIAQARQIFGGGY